MTTPRVAFLAGFLLVSSGMPQTTGSVGTLEVFVADEQGKPLAGARVSYQRIFATAGAAGMRPAPGEAVASGQAPVDSRGRFAAAGLPTGNYLVCADVPSATYLNPCTWKQPVRVAISADTISTRTIALTKGVYLRVRVNDPMGLLPSGMDAPLGVRKLLVGVTYADGAYQGARNVGADGEGRDYQLIIPANLPFKLWLFSRDVKLTDARGTAVDMSGADIPFQAHAGEDQVFSFTVSAPAAPSP